MAKKVLVVDDDQNAVKFLSVVLERARIRARSPPTTAAKDCRRSSRAKPDLIVLDVMMPKKTGFVLFKQLKRNDEYKDIPILMLTGVAGILEELERRRKTPSSSPSTAFGRR